MSSARAFLSSLEKFGMNLGLTRIEALLEKLGNPHLQFKSIHVAGTNGKGSTCAMIASILKEAGCNVGLYTSPHLFDYTERIKVNGKDIPQKDFERCLLQVKKTANNSNPTVFEVLTAAAFLCFAEKKVDYAVVEVGLGGRLDATNVITPLVSVITNIDYEHTAVLGKTLSKIAYEKGGVIKPKVPVITAEIKASPLKVIKRICEKNNAKLVLADGQKHLGGISLAGAHQKVNAACAVAAIKFAGIKIPIRAILGGLREVIWPARFQVVSNQPLTIVDGAHNPAGFRVMIRTLRENYPGKKFSFIIGSQKDKNSKLMLWLIRPLAKEIIVTRSSNRQAAHYLGGLEAIPLDAALKSTSTKDRVITGSLYLAGDAIKLISKLA